MLGVLTVGDAAGYPVIHNHGGLSSRLEAATAHDAALSHGLRIISPDRPGIATSDPRPGRALDHWASDVAELADALGLERFAVMGWSLGGSFAQAVAHHLGERTAALALIASAIPRQWPGMLEQINHMDRRFMALSRHASGRSVSWATFAIMGAAARRAPAMFARRSGVPDELRRPAHPCGRRRPGAPARCDRGVPDPRHAVVFRAFRHHRTDPYLARRR